MRRWVSQRGIFLGLLALVPAVGGCDSDSFTPPPPSGLKTSSSTSPTAPVRAKEIVLILPTEENVDLANYDDRCRTEAGNLKVSYRAYKPAPGDPPTRQAELISQAVGRGASALIVVPDRSKETAEALAAVDQKKTPIILLGRPLTSPTGSTTFPIVSFPPFAPLAKKIVGAVVEDVKKAGFPPDAPVLILHGPGSDESSVERRGAILDALKEAKLTVAATVDLVDQPEESLKILEAALRANPKVCALFGEDDMSIAKGPEARDKITPRSKFMVGGFIYTSANMVLVDMGNASALADRKVDALARKAMRTALDRAEGRSVPDRIEVELPYRRSKNALNPPSPTR
jgi:ABC-type sugar transport system substrate-binding protein